MSKACYAIQPRIKNGSSHTQLNQLPEGADKVILPSATAVHYRTQIDDIISAFTKTSLALCFLLATNLCFALSPEANLDRYLIAAEDYLDQKNYPKADQYLDRARSLDIDLPAKYHLFYGHVLHHNGKLPEARIEFELYIEKAGNEAEHYTKALKMITQIEETQTSREDVQKSIEQQSLNKGSMISRTNLSQQQSEKPLEQELQDLYLTDKAEDAIVKHINSILATYPYSGSVIQSANDREGVFFNLSLSSTREIVTTRQDRRQKPAIITTSRFEVYGKDPFVQHECDSFTSSCWVKNVNGVGKWLEIRLDERAAEELTQSITQLIKVLQKNQ